jgi:hypothetical protein
VNYERTAEDDEQSTGRDSSEKAGHKRNTSERLPDDNEPGNKFGYLPRCELFKRGLDSWGAKSWAARPSEKLLHAIGEDDDSCDDSQERVDII